MPNSIWYGLITFISIGVFIYTLKKKKSKKVVALYTFLSGITYFFEFVILNLFKSYVYYPNILKDNYFDNILGAVVSDAFSVPMVGTFVGSFQLGWKGICYIVGIFVLVEEGFVAVGAYEQYWWKTLYTAFGLLLCFVISKKWFKKLQQNPSTFVRFFTIYFTCLVIQASTVFVLVAFFNLYQYKIGLFENEIRDHVFFATTYILLIGFILTSLVIFKVSWYWKVAVLFSLSPVNWLLVKFGILHLSKNWSLVHFLILRFIILILLGIFNHFMFKSSNFMSSQDNLLPAETKLVPKREKRGKTKF